MSQYKKDAEYKNVAKKVTLIKILTKIILLSLND